MIDARRIKALTLLASLFMGAGWAAACGARSELDVVGEPAVGGQGGQPEDAGVDAPVDAPEDVPEDVPFDVPFPNECEDPETQTYIYVVTSENQLWAYKPETNTFEQRGTLNCPSNGSTPFSMAVSRSGIAYVVYQDGELYRVSVLNAACEPTPFVPGQMGFDRFGMGFAPNKNDEGETLYVAEINFAAPPLGLASIDLDTFQLNFIGPLSFNPGFALELTPTGSGPLWGYFLNDPPPGGTLVEIDTDNANVTNSIPVSVGNGSSALAVAWWGGAFYIFTTPLAGGTDVTRYDPTTNNATKVAGFGLTVVGAGVSTCAPDSLP